MPPSTMPGAKTTPIEPGIIDRLSGALRGMRDGWFGPGVPAPPVAPEGSERVLDYPTGYNLSYAPRRGEPITFAQLRSISEGLPILRFVIETRKDQVSKLDWSFRFKQKPGESKAQAAKRSVDDPKLNALRKFFQSPDGVHDWEQWSRMLLEDMLVIDAATLYVRRTNGGAPVEVEVFDGSTINVVIDERGKPIGYQQIIKGVPGETFVATELVYRPRNVRPGKLYGFSPVEQLVLLANIALRRDLTRLYEYTEGNIPAGFIKANKDWSVEQIKAFDLWLNTKLAGNLQQRGKLIVIPDCGDPIFPQRDALKDEFDDLMNRLVCYCFSVSPSNLVPQVNRATAESAHEEARLEGYLPSMRWLAATVERVVTVGWGYDDVEFAWESERDEDSKKQMEVDTGYVTGKILTPDEIRDDLGREALTDKQREAAWPTPPSPFGDPAGAFGKPSGNGKPPAAPSNDEQPQA